MVDLHTSSSLVVSTAVKSLKWVSSCGYRLVLAGRGMWETRFARGIWVGKSEIDDTHLVVDLERGIQKVRTVRRMPEEFRWNAEMLQNIRFTPWKPTSGEECTGCWTEHVHHGKDDRCSRNDGQLQKVFHRAGESFSGMSTEV